MKPSSDVFKKYFGEWDKAAPAEQMADAVSDVMAAPLKYPTMLKKATLAAMLTTLSKIILILKEDLKDYRPAIDCAIRILSRSQFEIDKTKGTNEEREEQLAIICREEVERVYDTIAAEVTKEIQETKVTKGTVN